MSTDVLQKLQTAVLALIKAGTISTTTYPRTVDGITLVTSRELLVYFLSKERRETSKRDTIDIDNLVSTESSANVLVRAICDACRATGLTQRKCVTMLRENLSTRSHFTDGFVSECDMAALSNMQLGPLIRKTQVKLWAIPTP